MNNPNTVDYNCDDLLDVIEDGFADGMEFAEGPGQELVDEALQSAMENGEEVLENAVEAISPVLDEAMEQAMEGADAALEEAMDCLLYTSPSPRD